MKNIIPLVWSATWFATRVLAAEQICCITTKFEKTIDLRINFGWTNINIIISNSMNEKYSESLGNVLAISCSSFYGVAFMYLLKRRLLICIISHLIQSHLTRLKWSIEIHRNFYFEIYYTSNPRAYHYNNQNQWSTDQTTCLPTKNIT